MKSTLDTMAEEMQRAALTRTIARSDAAKAQAHYDTADLAYTRAENAFYNALNEAGGHA